MLVVTGTALYVSSRQTPLYRASAQLLLQPALRDTVLDASVSYVDPDRMLKTEMQVLRSPPVEQEARKRLGYGAGVSAAPLPETNVVLLEAVNADPARAADIANTYGHAYIAVRQGQVVEELASAGQQMEAKIVELQRQIDALKATPSTSAREQANAAQSSQLNALITQQGVLRQKLDQLNIDASARSGGAQLVVPATAPSAPFSPDTRRNGLLALALGAAMGVALVLMREFLDDSINTQEDLTRAAPGTAVLGVIPYVRRWRARGPAVSLADPSSPAAEAYRTLRTSIKFLRLDTAVRLMQVTSPSAAEGKTSTVANLGVALAMAGQRVIVVCCDLRRPRLHESFGLDNTVGLTTVVVGEVALSDALQPVPGATGLRLLASGPLPPNPAELLSSRRGGDVLSALRDDADIVILDCPPLLPVTDAVVVSALVDATVVVTTANLTKRKELTRAIELLRQADAPLVGTVFNGVKAKGGSRYRYEHYGQRRRRLSKKRTRPALAAADPALDGDATSTPEVSQPPADAPSSSASSSGASSAAAAQRTVDASGDGQPAHVAPSPSGVPEPSGTDAAAQADELPEWMRSLLAEDWHLVPDDEHPGLLIAQTGRKGADEAGRLGSDSGQTCGPAVEALVIPPSASTPRRVIDGAASILYAHKGFAHLRFGADLAREQVIESGGFCLIPSDTTYRITNLSDSDELEAILAQPAGNNSPASSPISPVVRGANEVDT